MYTIFADGFHDGYGLALAKVMNYPDVVCSPRGQKINECLNVCMEIKDVSLNSFKNPARDLPKDYLYKELILYYSGANEAEAFGKASKFWNQLVNPDYHTVNSAYGHLIFKVRDAYHPLFGNQALTQWEWVRHCLIKDKDSRQAVMHYNRPSHQWFGNKDFVCTMSNQFFIRSNKLYLTTYIRSNDCIKGITFDIPWFISLMYVMKNELQAFYPELELGSYTHFAGSLHIYERDFELVNNMLKNEFIHDSIKMPEVTDNPILNPNSAWINYLKDELKKYDNIKFIE